MIFIIISGITVFHENRAYKLIKSWFKSVQNFSEIGNWGRKEKRLIFVDFSKFGSKWPETVWQYVE